VSALLNVNGTVGRGSAAVDLNLVPGLAISRIEVLRDGASSQYGSDAIAGVINIQLKKANHGGRASMTYDKYVSTLHGVVNVTGLQLDSAGQPQLNPADTRFLLANTNGEREVRDGAQLTIGVNVGLPLGQRGYLNLTAEYRDRKATNRQAFDLRPNYVRPSSTTFDLREATFNRLNFRFGDSATKDYNSPSIPALSSTAGGKFTGSDPTGAAIRKAQPTIARKAVRPIATFRLSRRIPHRLMPISCRSRPMVSSR